MPKTGRTLPGTDMLEEERGGDRGNNEDMERQVEAGGLLYVSSGSAVPGTVPDPRRVCDEYLSSG